MLNTRSWLPLFLQITGGRNGYGAKLANIFSSEFTVETCDGSRQRRYKQTFTHNMTKKGQPKITDCKASDNWTCITFKPDLAKFGMTELDEDIVSVLRRRVYDMAAVLGKGAKVGIQSAAAGTRNIRSRKPRLDTSSWFLVVLIYTSVTAP